jgi:AraC-like DNA-binding protein
MKPRTGIRAGRRSGDASSGTIRAGALLGFHQLVGDLGGDADALLAASGIDPAALASPDHRISYGAMIKLLEDCALRLDCPDFGLRLSSYQDIDILGPAAMIARHSDTVGEALGAIASYLFVHTTAANMQLTAIDPEYTSMSYEVLIPGLHARRQINELTVGIGQNLLDLLIGSGFRSERVLFTHRKPDDLRPLVRRFGRHLYFDEPVNALAVPNQGLTKPVPTANPEFRRIAVNYVRDHLGASKDDPLHRIVMLVRQLLPTGRCSLQAVSRTLGIHPRTLQRELRSSGADFRGIVDSTRRELVADYLLHTNASLTQIAAMLGYGDQAAFHVAFKRWYGMPPGHWRRSRLKQ